MKILQNILIVIVALLICAGLFTEGWLSVGLCSGAAVAAIATLAFINHTKNKK